MARMVRTVATLRTKRDEVAKAVVEYERRLAKARADLDRLDGVIVLFEQTGDVYRLFRKGEAMMICKEALKAGPLTHRDMVACIMDAKDLDRGDLLLQQAIGGRLDNSLVHQQRRGGLAVSGKYRTARLWRLS